MKRIFATVLAILMLLSLSAGAMADEEASSSIVGELTMAGQTEDELDDSIASSRQKINVPEASINVVYFDNLSSMLLALQSERIDRISVVDSVGEYLLARNPDTYAQFNLGIEIRRVSNLCMALTDGNADLLEKLNAAITEIQANGTMEALKKTWVDDVISGGEPFASAIPTIDGAETLRVVVTGDLPPFDFVTTDGQAAGFNIALLSQISKCLNMNVELIMSDAGSRAAMLASGRADVVFWMRNNETHTPDGTLLHI